MRMSLRPILRLRTLLIVLGSLACFAMLGSTFASANPPTEGVININTASAEKLTWLPGIGDERAQRIVDFRRTHRFKRTVELARVRGIGLKTVRKLKLWLTVDGPTTLEGPIKMTRAKQE